MGFNLEFNIDNHSMYNEEKKDFEHSARKFHVFPYTTSPAIKDPIVKDFNKLVGNYFSFLIEKYYKVDSKDDVIEKILNNNDICSDQLKKELSDILKEFYNDDKKLSTSNLDILISSASNDYKNKKYANYLLNVLGNKDNLKKIIDKEQSEYSNVLEKLICSNLNDISNIKSNNNDFEFIKINNSLDKVFETDFEYIISNKYIFSEYFVEFLEFYYFMYVTQVILQLDKFLDGRRDKVENLIFFLDWESVSGTRFSNNDEIFFNWKEIFSKRFNLFCHVNLLAVLNTSNTSDYKYDYIAIKEDLNNIDDEHISKIIDQYAEKYKEYFNDMPELDDIKKQNVPNKSKIEQSIHYFYKIIKEQFNSPSKSGIQTNFSNHYIKFSDKYLKSRGNLGKTFNITKDFLIMLTTLVIGNNEKIHISDLFDGFKDRGIYLDKTSKKYILDYYDNDLNIIDSKSDSGEVKYVKRIM